jgi:hypothetical protein
MLAVLHGVTYWRDLAEEARAVAEHLTTPDAKRIMVDVAESYEKLAEGAQQRILIDFRDRPRLYQSEFRQIVVCP